VSREKEEAGESITMRVRNPHSVLFFAGETLGAWEALQGGDYSASVHEDADGSYLVRCEPGGHPVGLEGRLNSRRYTYRPGRIETDRCVECGVPAALGRYVWDIGEGTITDRESGRRMAVFGPAGLEAVLDDLAFEQGEEIPAAVVEAQRGYVRRTAGDGGKNRGRTGDRQNMAVRGLGNLRSYEEGRDRVRVVIENACLNLVTVGTFQALFEIRAGAESSSCEYGLAGDGTLSVTISAT
jgi:hypothetical protein